MDNHQRSTGGFLQHLLDANPQIGHAIQNFLHGFTHSQSPEPSLPVDDPDLEPTDLTPSTSGPVYSQADREMTLVEDIARSVGTLSIRSSSPDPDPVHQDQDRFALSSSASTRASTSQGHELPHRGLTPGYESDNSMPLLRHGSDPDNDDIDTRGPQTSSHPQPSQPESEQTRPFRRARVDDDVDEDDLRETNRQRLHSPDPPHALSSNIPPPQAEQQPPHDGPHNRPPPPPYSFVYTFDIFPPPPPRSPQPQQQQPSEGARPHQQTEQGAPHDRHHHHPPHPPMFNFMFTIPMSSPTNAPGDSNAPGAVPPPLGRPGFEFFAMPIGMPPPTGMNAGTTGTPLVFPFSPLPFPFPFGMGAPREEADDSERAQRLVRGLEAVPEGLVKRMEAISQRHGGQEACCAVCWESLSAEGGGFEEDKAEERDDNRDRMDVDGEVTEATAEAPASPSDASVEGGEQKCSAIPSDLPRVVALPCAHVFHTACLLPWFAKPHRTTCPSCRFDIDPDSLTYMAPSQRRQQHPQRQAQPQPQTQPQSAPAPGATVAAPGQPEAAAASGPTPNAGQRPQVHPGVIPPLNLNLEFGLFFPAMPGSNAGGNAAPGADAGRRPAFVPLDPQITRRVFEQMFGDFAQPQAQQPQQQPPQPRAQEGPIPHILPQSQGQGATAQTNITPDAPQEPQRPGRFWELFFSGITGMPGMPGTQPADGNGSPPQATAPGPTPQDPTAPRATGTRPRPPEKRQWTLPAPPGPTLRQRVERQERELGLRCADVSCGLGPSDEDPILVVDPSQVRQIGIKPVGSGGKGETTVCEHTFHPACLVSAERVAGWGGEDKKEGRERDGDVDGEVEVSCPICRAVGAISRTDWDEGACALA